MGILKWIIVVVVIIVIGSMIGLPMADYIKEVLQIKSDVVESGVDIIDEIVTGP